MSHPPDLKDLDGEMSRGQPGGSLWLGNYRGERIAKAQCTRWLNAHPSDSRRPFGVRITKQPLFDRPGYFQWRAEIVWGALLEKIEGRRS